MGTVFERCFGFGAGPAQTENALTSYEGMVYGSRECRKCGGGGAG